MTPPYLGLDIGLTRTGVAISESGIVAQPIGVIECTPPHRHELLTNVLRYIREYGVQTIVVGIPLTSDDAPTAQASKVEAAIAELTAHLSENGTHPTFVTVNEFGSTQSARRGHGELDDNAAAAAIILQEYLDSQ